jgi:hypothetical protein
MKSIVLSAMAAVALVLSIQTTATAAETAKCHFDMFCNYYVYLLQEKGINATEVFKSGKDRFRANVLLPDGKMEYQYFDHISLERLPTGASL